MEQKKYIDIILKNITFKDLDQEGFKILFDNSFIRNYKKGDIILKEGDSGEEFFIIVEGAVEISTYKDNSIVNLALLKPGAILGEVSALNSTKRTATAKADIDSKLIVFKKIALLRLIKKYDFLKKRFDDMILARAKDTISKLND